MSLAALLEATRTTILKATSLTDRAVLILDDGSPIPLSPEKFVSVHPTSWSPYGPEVVYGLGEVYNLACTLSFRTGAIPADRRFSVFQKSFTGREGMDALARKIMVAIHQSSDLITLANEICEANTSNGIIEPLRWLGNDLPYTVDGSWFNTEPEKESGLVMVCNFGGALRMQSAQEEE